MTLAKCLQRPEGMAALRAELAAGGETDAAMAFLATAIKDHGAVPASNSLYRSVTLSIDHHSLYRPTLSLQTNPHPTDHHSLCKPVSLFAQVSRPLYG